MSSRSKQHRTSTEERLTSKGQLAHIETSRIHPALFDLPFPLQSHPFLVCRPQTKAGRWPPRLLYFLPSLLCLPPFAIGHIVTEVSQGDGRLCKRTSLRGHWGSCRSGIYCTITAAERFCPVQIGEIISFLQCNLAQYYT